MCADEVSAHVSERRVDVTWGAEIGGTAGRLDWYAEYGDVAHVERLVEETLADPATPPARSCRPVSSLLGMAKTLSSG